MKRLHTIFTGAALTLLTAGCNGFLDLSSYDEVSSATAFSTTTLAESVVTGAYSNILYDYIDGTRSRLNWDAFSSVMDPSAAMVYLNYSYLTGTIQPNDASFLTYWKRFYEGVNRANDVINNIGSCPTMSDAVKRQRIAECKFLRAFHYYRLNCLWRGVPVYLENLAPGAYTRGRSSEEEVWRVIIDDLNDCIACEELPGKYRSSDSDYGRVTKGAAYTLRGKVRLWMKQWEEAEQDFLKVGELGYDLYQGSYADLFKLANEKCDEMIFSAQMEEVEGFGNVFSYTYGNMVTKGNGNSSFFMNARFVDSYPWADGRSFDWDEVIEGYDAMTPRSRSVYFLRDNLNPTESAAMQTYGADLSKYLSDGNETRIRRAYADRDPRLAATVITPYSVYKGGASGAELDYVLRWPFRSSAAPLLDLETRSNSYMLYSIRKFVTSGNEYGHIQYNPVDVPIFRYADVLLCLAEAVNEQGRYSEAVGYVNRVRKRAGIAELNEAGNPHVVVNSAEELRPRIRDEKKWELACEEQLYCDELRWGTWRQDKFAAGNGLSEVWGAPVYEYRWGGEAYLKWPVPSSEREKNPNLVQNDAWH